jgi:hypothetical protein
MRCCRRKLLAALQKEPEHYRLAEWLQTELALKAYREGDAELRRTRDALAGSHARMHHSADGLSTLAPLP